MYRFFIMRVVILCLCLPLLSACIGPVPIPLVAALGTATVATSKTEKGLATSLGDSVISLKLKDKLLQEDAGLFSHVTAAVNNGTVLLTGKIDTIERKSSATRLAWSIKGVREVINELQITSETRFNAKDFSAQARLRSKLIFDKEITSGNFDIDVVEGIVYLSGVATDDAKRDRVIAHARETKFVQRVVNYIVLETDKRD